MEAFNLLRYWRTNSGDDTSNATVSTSTATTTTIVTGVNSPASETEDEENENDHGPFFDLEFSLPNDETENDSDCREEEEEEEDDSDGSDELKFTVLSGSTGDVNVSVSPSDELFFNDGFVPVDQTPEINSKPPEFRLSLMKSATKFRVMMLKFRKTKSNDESIESTDSKEELKPDSGKSMTVKLKRHKSSKASKKQQIKDNERVSGSSDEKKSPTETMQRYFRKVKPLYIRVSKKYGEKLKFTGQQTFPGATKPNSTPSPSPTTEEQKQSPTAVSEPPLLPINANRLKQGNLPAGIRVVCKRFGKTWSASTPVTVSAAAAPPAIASSNRRDDSLLQQQDGIQSAILHCKRSFKAARDSDCSSSMSSAPAPENMYSEVTKKINER